MLLSPGTLLHFEDKRQCTQEIHQTHPEKRSRKTVVGLQGPCAKEP